MPVVRVGTYAAILTGPLLTEVPPGLAVFPHPARFTVALVVVDKLDTVGSSFAITGAGQTLVDISLTSLSGVARHALTLVATDFVNTDTAMMTRALETLVEVLLAKSSHSSRRARAREVIDQIVAYSTVSTRIGGAIVDVVLALCSLESRGTSAAVVSLVVVACRAVVARIAVTGISLMLTVGAPVAVPAVAGVRGAGVSTTTSVSAEPRH